MKVFRKCIVRVKSSSPKVIFDCIDEPIWGVWEGLFGLANNEAIAITLSEKDEPSFWSDGVEVLDEERLLPTARPTSTDRPTKEGLYVFRSMLFLSRRLFDCQSKLGRLSKEMVIWSRWFKPGPDGARCGYLLGTMVESWRGDPHPERICQRHCCLLNECYRDSAVKT